MRLQHVGGGRNLTPWFSALAQTSKCPHWTCSESSGKWGQSWTEQVSSVWVAVQRPLVFSLWTQKNQKEVLMAGGTDARQRGQREAHSAHCLGCTEGPVGFAPGLVESTRWTGGLEQAG